MLFKKNFTIYYNHTDLSGAVYHANYLIFFEQTRSAFLNKIGLKQDELLSKEDAMFTVTNINITYRSPAKFNDTIYVSVEDLEVAGPRVKMYQKIYNKANNILTECEVQCVAINKAFKLYRKIPEQIKNKLLKAKNDR